MPKVSVLMPNYNCDKYITEAIESILCQSFIDFEFIIIDDASTDRSWDIIQKYVKQDKRIRALRNKDNIGVHETRNLLFREAKGEYYALFDSDDIAHSDRLDIQSLFLDKNIDISLLGSNFVVINAQGELTAQKIFPENDVDIRKSFFWRNPFGQNTVMLRRECIENVGMYDPRYAVAEDLDLWMRIGAQYKMYNLQQDLLSYRIHGTNSILMRQKEMLSNTMKIRLESRRLGYHMGVRAYFSYAITWCAQCLPPRLVLAIFNILVTKPSLGKKI